MHSASSTVVSRSIAVAVSNATSGVRARFLLLAAIAASADLITKALATGLLRDGNTVSISDRLAFVLVYNTGGAGGLMMGPNTWGINVAITSLAILMVMRIVVPLSAVAPRATMALGLVTGGAVGNLASMLAGPNGVADFLAVRVSDSTTMVMNGADLLLWSGALCLVPVVTRLIGAVRAERAER